jgi:hypothetical protein
MTKIVARVIIVILFVFCKSLMAQNVSAFQQAHTQLLDNYVLFIDSVEKKHQRIKYIDIFKHKHISEVEFKDSLLVYRIRKKVKVYKNGLRYEKIDWTIRYHHKFLHHKIYEIKQLGHDYRFIEQIDYDYGRKLKRTKVTSSFDDNYVLIRTFSPKEKRGSHFYVKPMSSLPLIHQD